MSVMDLPAGKHSMTMVKNQLKPVAVSAAAVLLSQPLKEVVLADYRVTG